MGGYFQTQGLSVGYSGKVLIHDINLSIEKGKILTLIGPNGAGKSTILKSITRHLEKIGGVVLAEGQDLAGWSNRELARRMAVVLTDRVRPELMTCGELVAMGRYPYTNALGKLTPEDKAVVRQSLERVHGLELEDRDYNTLSDGQKQRILLARAICQQPEILVLDEPTSYLDIRYKIELLDILREMAHDQGITVILSLHDIDLATKISDYLICVKGDTIAKFGPPDEILRDDTINQLYEIQKGSYNLLFGSVEMGRPEGEPQVFVIGGGGFGIPCYRLLQKHQIPFATGLLMENDVDCHIARELSDYVAAAPAFFPASQADYDKAAGWLARCREVVDAGTPVGKYNQANARLLALAEQKGIPVRKGREELEKSAPALGKKE